MTISRYEQSGFSGKTRPGGLNFPRDAIGRILSELMLLTSKRKAGSSTCTIALILEDSHSTFKGACSHFVGLPTNIKSGRDPDEF